jgi:hypothetical protein
MHLEEYTLLTKLVQLGIAVEKTSANELIEDTENKGGHDGKQDVVEGECPGFVDNLTREGVLERVLLAR